jgi:hypothetical protein
MKKHIELITIGFYISLMTVILFVIQQIWFSNLLAKANFLNWDAEHYEFIKSFGYEGYRVAFFPLFPLVWKFLSFGVYGVVVFNAFVFLISFYFLIKKFKIDKPIDIALFLSIPSFIFFYLPYSESIFFLCSIFILFGLKDKKYMLVYVGLFLAILARPAFTVFIPALIITELFGEFSRKMAIRIGIYFCITLLGIYLVTLIQYLDTGEWFKFFNAQKYWGNELQLPKFPLTSWAGGFIVRLDGIAFLFGVLAGGFLLAAILRVKNLQKNTIPPEVIFSLAYLGGLTLTVFLFRGGSLFSLNRFLFATPFIIIALNFWFKSEFSISTKQLLLIFGTIFLFWLLFGSYVHIQLMLKYLLVTSYATLVFSSKSKIEMIRKFSVILLVFTNFTFQVVLFVRFFLGDWVG